MDHDLVVVVEVEEHLGPLLEGDDDELVGPHYGGRVLHVGSVTLKTRHVDLRSACGRNLMSLSDDRVGCQGWQYLGEELGIEHGAPLHVAAHGTQILEK